MGVFVIAEAGSSHDNDLQKAYRLIEAAKECGADAVKFQWTSSGDKLRARRQLDDAEGRIRKMYQTYLEKPVSWLESLKAHADKVGIEFMCTVYLIEDIAVIAPLVKRFKISAFERDWDAFKDAHYKCKKPVIISTNKGDDYYFYFHKRDGPWDDRGIKADIQLLHCVSEYPTALEKLKLSETLNPDCNCETPFSRCQWLSGFSDHTANVLTGAAAVAAGAKIVEAHIRLVDTDENNPDYKHSLVAAKLSEPRYRTSEYEFAQYVRNIRTVERML